MQETLDGVTTTQLHNHGFSTPGFRDGSAGIPPEIVTEKKSLLGISRGILGLRLLFLSKLKSHF